MGYVRKQSRDPSKYETVYEDPNYDRIRPFGGRRQDKLDAALLTGGSSLETLGGLIAVIAGVIGFWFGPVLMSAIATIAIGIGLLAEGSSIMARWRANLKRLDGPRFDRNEMVGGMSTEVFGGLVGIVLGIVALFGVSPLVLLPTAAIVFGGSLLLGGAAQRELVFLAPERNPRVARFTYGAIQVSGGTMVLVGVGAAVLGILALLDVGPILTFTLVAMLCIGAAMLFAGSALTARFVRRFT
jgi:hypothetical protein